MTEGSGGGAGSENRAPSPGAALKWIRATDDPSPDAACIEIAEAPDGLIHLRQSDDPSHIVTTTRTKWRAFVMGVRNDEFDHFVQEYWEGRAKARRNEEGRKGRMRRRN